MTPAPLSGLHTRRAWLLATGIALLAFWAAPHAQAAAPAPPTLDADVAHLMAVMKAPGVAVAIVKDGELVLAQGWGLRQMGSAERVDADTVFAIASNTKAFTAVVLAMLVDEGKLGWDDPVTKHLPAFQMSDPYVTREITVRDLLIHHSGLPLGAGDLLWVPPTTFSADEIVAAIRHLKPVRSFRSGYAYDNVLYVVAGQVIAAVTGKPWEDAVAERILRPLGMHATSAGLPGLLAANNRAAPHSMDDGDNLAAHAPWATGNVLAAAGLNASANDMARWMTVLLDAGSLASTGQPGRLYSERRAREMWSLWTPMQPSVPPPALAATRSEFLGYGLGFQVADYRGHKTVLHGGTLTGYTSRLLMLPALKLGIFVATNQWHSSSARRALVLRIADHYLGVAPTDWVSLLHAVDIDERKQARATVAAERAKRATDAGAAGTAADTPARTQAKTPKAYAGNYTDAWLGAATVAQEGELWTLRFARSPGLVGDLEHWRGDIFIARWRDRSLNADAYVSFVLNPDATVAEVRMKAVSAETDFSFDFHDLKLLPVAGR